MHYRHGKEDDYLRNEGMEEIPDFFSKTESHEALDHRKDVRKRLEARLERKRLRQEIGDDWEELEH